MYKPSLNERRRTVAIHNVRSSRLLYATAAPVGDKQGQARLSGLPVAERDELSVRPQQAGTGVLFALLASVLLSCRAICADHHGS